MTAVTSGTTRRLRAPPDDALLHPGERMSVDELRALQLKRLQCTLGHGYEPGPHCGQGFGAAGVHPDDCRERSDLARFPATSNADLRDNFTSGMLAVAQEQVGRVS